MRFSIVTDELHPEPRQAIELGLSWGINEFEIRNLRGVRFPRMDDTAIEELIALRDKYGIHYTAVSPGFFKHSLEDHAQVDYAFGEGLKRCLAFMEACQVPVLICFGFELSPQGDSEAVRLLRAFAKQLSGHAVRVAVENEVHCTFNTPERIATMIEAVDRPNLGSNWDLANLQEGAAEGYPAGYERVKPYIFNVHVKDWAMVDGRRTWRPVGHGVCDWRGQIRALARDGVVERVTIESHCEPLYEVGQHNLNTLKEYLA